MEGEYPGAPHEPKASSRAKLPSPNAPRAARDFPDLPRIGRSDYTLRHTVHYYAMPMATSTVNVAPPSFQLRSHGSTGAVLAVIALAWFPSHAAHATDPIDLAAFRGQVVYLDFWASWCAPCLESFPFLNHLQQTLGPQGLTIIAVNLDRSRADADRFLQAHPAQFRVIFDPDGVLPQRFSVHGMPSSFLIDRTGIVQLRHEGFRRADRDLLEQQVRSWVTQH
jgi:cytochrome c biogenesis protein CcmG, thiol:disulfide interchange protein DsbE